MPPVGVTGVPGAPVSCESADGSLDAAPAALPVVSVARRAALLLTGKGGDSGAATLSSGILSGDRGFSAFVELPGSWRGVRGAGGFPDTAELRAAW